MPTEISLTQTFSISRGEVGETNTLLSVIGIDLTFEYSVANELANA